MPILKKIKSNKYRKADIKYLSKKNNENHKFVYNTRAWRNLRIQKLQKNQLCEMCLEQNKIRLGTTVHHKQIFSDIKNKMAKQMIAFDFQNLITVCDDCHKKLHNDKNK